MYVNAIRIYENALQKEDKEGLGEQFGGGIYHNMGCAYLHLFQFTDAAECFKRAYQLLHTKQVLQHYLLASYLENPESFPAVCMEMGIEDRQEQELTDMLLEAGKNVQPVSGEQAERILNRFIRDYHRSTGF